MTSPGGRRTILRGWRTSERPSGTVTFLSTDIEGSTALLRSLGQERYGDALWRHQVLVREAVSAHRGHEVDTQGDAFLVAFRGASAAVAAAVAIQRALAAEPWPEGANVRVRIGIHSGEASAARERYVGMAVHRAARVGAVAHGGQVVLSDAARVLVEDDLPAGVSLRDLGSHQLKDIARPERIWQVVAVGLPSAFPALKTGGRRRVPRIAIAAVAVVLGVGAATAAVLLTRGSTGGVFASAPVAADSVGVFATASGHPVAQTRVQTSPGAITADEHGVWVANADSASVSRLDPKTGAVQQTIPVGNGPAGVTIAGGAVWVTNSLDGTVARIDPQTNTRVQTIHVGSQPGPITSGLGGVWVANKGDRTITLIDTGSGRKRRTLPLATGLDALAVGDGALWVASELNGTVERVDPLSGASVSINVGRAPDAIAAGAGGVWVANNLDASVMRISPTTNAVVATVQVDAGPAAVAVAADGKAVWVSNELAGTLVKIDPARNQVTGRLELRDRPEGIALAGGRLYAAVRTSGSAHRGGTLRVAESIRLEGPKSELLDPAGLNGYLPFGGLFVYDGLVAFRRAGGGEGLFLVPDLAVSLPTPTDGGLTYTFQLRTGIRYSSNRLVEPADFRRAIERAIALGGGPDGIVGAAACVRKPKHCDLSRGITTSASTVTFHLSRPDAAFLYELAQPSAVAVPADTPLHLRFPIPATGPYMYGSVDVKRQLIRLVRNPRFHPWSAAARPDGFPDAILVRFGFTVDGAIRAVERGSADLAGAGTNSPGVRSELRIRYRSLLHSYPTIATYGVELNTHIPPFDDRRARQAFNYAVDRNRVVGLAGGPDLATPTCQLLPPNLSGYRRYCPYMRGARPAGSYTGPDIAEARALVAESQTRGDTVVFRDHLRQPGPITRYLVSVLRSLGYRVRLLIGDHAPGDQVNYVGGWVVDYPDASDMLVPLAGCRSGFPNVQSFCNPRIDREMASALSLDADRPQAAAKLWAKVDRDVTDEAPWVPYFNGRSFAVVSRRVGNYVYSAINGGPLYDQLWVR